jgi:hypothetical protein
MPDRALRTADSGIALGNHHLAARAKNRLCVGIRFDACQTLRREIHRGQTGYTDRIAIRKDSNAILERRVIDVNPRFARCQECPCRKLPIRGMRVEQHFAVSRSHEGIRNEID